MDYDKGGVTVDYSKLANIIAVKAHSTRDEAWGGLSTAYLTLDRTRTEQEQVAYLLKVGVLAVKNELRSKYIDSNSGVLRMEPMTSEVGATDERTSERLANDIGKVLNLSSEAVGVIRSIADGECGASRDAIRWHLRNKGIAKSRSKTTEVLNALQRISSQQQ